MSLCLWTQLKQAVRFALIAVLATADPCIAADDFKKMAACFVDGFYSKKGRTPVHFKDVLFLAQSFAEVRGFSWESAKSPGETKAVDRKKEPLEITPLAGQKVISGDHNDIVSLFNRAHPAPPHQGVQDFNRQKLGINPIVPIRYKILNASSKVNTSPVMDPAAIEALKHFPMGSAALTIRDVGFASMAGTDMLNEIVAKDPHWVNGDPKLSFAFAFSSRTSLPEELVGKVIVGMCRDDPDSKIAIYGGKVRKVFVVGPDPTDPYTYEFFAELLTPNLEIETVKLSHTGRSFPFHVWTPRPSTP